MLFIAARVVRPNTVDMRKEARPAHLAVHGLGARVNLGGAFLGPDHESPVGSVLVFEVKARATSSPWPPTTRSRWPVSLRASA